VTENGHPTRDELLVMAYVDDELAAEVRSDFQARLANEPELVRQVAVYQKLEVLARQMAPPEPRDHEWERVREEPLQRAGRPLGSFLLVAGALGLAAWAAVLLLGSGLALWAKICALATVSGFLLLLALRWRLRLRLAPYDPYEEVRR